MNSSNENNSKEYKDVEDYISILVDAENQRSTPESVQNSHNVASCIQEIHLLLKKHNISTPTEIINTLVSVMVIPLQMLEPDPKEREHLMKDLANDFVRTIIAMQVRDTISQSTEQGKELDRLRFMLKKSGVFKS